MSQRASERIGRREDGYYARAAIQRTEDVSKIRLHAKSSLHQGNADEATSRSCTPVCLYEVSEKFLL